jgi:hypothetical protein
MTPTEKIFLFIGSAYLTILLITELGKFIAKVTKKKK